MFVKSRETASLYSEEYVTEMTSEFGFKRM